ncbi:MAG: hypothetical protein ACRD29_15480 [Acidimicrobiales bacterium]
MVPVLAHGVGARGDLPLPFWLFAYAASFALLISFAALWLLWPKPRLAAATAGRDLPDWIQQAAPRATTVARIVGLALFLGTFVAAAFGQPDAAANVAPYLLYVAFWVGMQFAVPILGDVWRTLNPLDTLARAFRIPDRGDTPQWTAAVMLLSFAWLELAYYEPSDPRVIALWLGAYTVAAMAGASVWGRGWLRTGEGFSALFGLLAHLAPFYRDPDSRRLRVRVPLAGLAEVTVRRGTAAVVVVALGSTSFDGVTRSQVWTNLRFDHSLVGWRLTAVSTAGLLATVAAVGLVYWAATAVVAAITKRPVAAMAKAFVPSLIPIVLAYTVAHYFSLLVFESQTTLALASDPLGRGWDLLGTVHLTPDYNALSSSAIAWVQAGAIVVGHILGVTAAHDRAVELFPVRKAMNSQLPMVGAMVAYTVGGLALLLGT